VAVRRADVEDRSRRPVPDSVTRSRMDAPILACGAIGAELVRSDLDWNRCL